jgi:hypothetical protein
MEKGEYQKAYDVLIAVQNPDATIKALLQGFSFQQLTLEGDNGTKSANTYNEQGLLLTMNSTRYDGSWEKKEYTYDAKGNVLTENYADSFGIETTTTYTIVESGKGVSVESLKFRAELHLVRNVSYRLVFWAQAPGNTAYDVDFEKATVVADYSASCMANDETRDAFYNYIDVKLTKDETFPVALFRPLAQINFGSDKVDYNALAPFLNDGLKSTIAVEGIPDTFSLTEGTLSGSAKVEFAADFAPVYNKEVLKGYEDKYEYVGMNYVFAASQKQNMPKDLTATFIHDSDEIVVTVPNVPYCANYRTNILGFLFTEKLITEIEVKPIPYGDEIVDSETIKTN